MAVLQKLIDGSEAKFMLLSLLEVAGGYNEPKIAEVSRFDEVIIR